MRALAITGMVTAEMMPSIMSGSLIRDTPPWARMSAGTRSSAITATAPAPSAMRACSGVTTSMMTPPLSISAMPRLTRAVPVWLAWLGCAALSTDLLRSINACTSLVSAKPGDLAAGVIGFFRLQKERRNEFRRATAGIEFDAHLRRCGPGPDAGRGGGLGVTGRGVACCGGLVRVGRLRVDGRGLAGPGIAGDDARGGPVCGVVERGGGSG